MDMEKFERCLKSEQKKRRTDGADAVERSPKRNKQSDAALQVERIRSIFSEHAAGITADNLVDSDAFAES